MPMAQDAVLLNLPLSVCLVLFLAGPRGPCLPAGRLPLRHPAVLTGVAGGRGPASVSPLGCIQDQAKPSAKYYLLMDFLDSTETL